jgi:hypothetical protein
MSAPDDCINTCVGCHNRLGAKSCGGYVVTALGLAEFRLCKKCRAVANNEMLQRIAREGAERLVLLCPAEGSA